MHLPPWDKQRDRSSERCATEDRSAPLERGSAQGVSSYDEEHRASAGPARHYGSWHGRSVVISRSLRRDA